MIHEDATRVLLRKYTLKYSTLKNHLKYCLLSISRKNCCYKREHTNEMSNMRKKIEDSDIMVKFVVK